MNKSSKFKRFLQIIAITLAVILAFPQTPFANALGISFTEVHADPAPSVFYLGQPYFIGNNLVLTPKYEGDSETTGSITYEYRVFTPNNGDYLPGEYVSITSNGSVSEPYIWAFSEDDIGKTIQIKATYSGDTNFTSDECVTDLINLISPIIPTLSSVTRNNDIYSFNISMNDISLEVPGIKYYYCITPNNQVITAEELREQFINFNYMGTAPQGFISYGSGNVEDFSGETVVINGSEFAEGTYTIHLIAMNDIGIEVPSVRICSDVAEINFSVFSPFTASDITATCADNLVYQGTALTPGVILSAISEDENRKAAVAAWITAAKGNISFSFKQIEEWDGSVITGASTGSAITVAGLYEIYASGTYNNCSIANESLGTVSIAREKSNPASFTLNTDVTGRTQTVKFSVDITGEENLDPTGTVSYKYSLDNGINWKNITDGVLPGAEYTWINSNLEETMFLVKASYSGDLAYNTATKTAIIDFVSPSLDKISEITRNNTSYTFTISSEEKELLDKGTLYYLFTPYNKNGYGSTTATKLLDKPSGSQVFTYALTEDGFENSFTLDGSALTEGTYVLQVVIMDQAGNISNKLVSNAFSTPTTYSDADLSASLKTPISYTGSAITPEITLTVISEDTGRNTVAKEWLTTALTNNKISYSFKQIKDGNGNVITTSVPASTVTDAGIYEIYATSSDAGISIINKSLGTFSVSKKTIDVSDVEATLTSSVSEDMSSYTVTAGITPDNIVGVNDIQYKFNDGTFSSQNTYTTDKAETVAVTIQFVSNNIDYGNSTITANIQTKNLSAIPVLTASTEFENSISVIIKNEDGFDAVYYTTDGTEPNTNSSKFTDETKTLDITETTTVKAVYSINGKLLNNFATTIYTKKSSDNPSPDPNPNPNPNPNPSPDPNSGVVSVKGISFDKEEINLTISDEGKETATLTAIIDPTYATNQAVTWSVAPKGIVSLKSNKDKNSITITPKKGGTAVITAISKDNNTVFAKINVTVTDNHKKHDWEVALGSMSFPANIADSVFEATATCKYYKEVIDISDSMKFTYKDTNKETIYNVSFTDPDGKKHSFKVTYNKKKKKATSEKTDNNYESAAPEAYNNESWNLFYIRPEGIIIPTGGVNLLDKNGNLGANTGKSYDYYNIEPTKDGLKVTLKDAADRKRAANQKNSIISLPVFDDNGTEIGQFDYILPVYYYEPSLKLSENSGKIKEGVETVLKTNVLQKMSTRNYEPLDLSDAKITYTTDKNSADVAIDDGIGNIKITASTKCTVTISIQDADWSMPITLKYTVKTANKDFITATINGNTFKKICFNTNAATENDFEGLVVDILLNGSTKNLGDITVSLPKNESGLVVEGIDNDGKLTGTSITFNYPKNPSSLKTGTYKYILLYKGVKYTLTVNVNNKKIENSVSIKQQNALDITTGQSAIFIPILQSISGIISEEITISDERFEGVYIPELNQIVVSLKDGQTATKETVKTNITLTVSGIKVTVPISIKISTTRPTVKINQVMLLGSKLNTTGPLGCTEVYCTYKLDKSIFNIDPISITPISSGSSTITKVEGKENEYKDSYTGATLTVNSDNTISISGPIVKAGNIKVEIMFAGDVKITTSFSIKINKKK